MRLKLRGMTYTTNNSVILLDSIGNTRYEALLCQTAPMSSMCPLAWLFPNGSEVTTERGQGIYRQRSCMDGNVFLLRQNNVVSPSGRYCCMSGGNENFCVILGKWLYCTHMWANKHF